MLSNLKYELCLAFYLTVDRIIVDVTFFTYVLVVASQLW